MDETCDQCNKQFKNRETFLKHMRTMHGVRRNQPRQHDDEAREMPVITASGGGASTRGAGRAGREINPQPEQLMRREQPVHTSLPAFTPDAGITDMNVEPVVSRFQSMTHGTESGPLSMCVILDRKGCVTYSFDLAYPEKNPYPRIHEKNPNENILCVRNLVNLSNGLMSPEVDQIEGTVHKLLAQGRDDVARYTIEASTFARTNRDLFRRRGIEYKRANDLHIDALRDENDTIKMLLNDAGDRLSATERRNRSLSDLYLKLTNLIHDIEISTLTMNQCNMFRMLFLLGANSLKTKQMHEYPDGICENVFICDELTRLETTALGQGTLPTEDQPRGTVADATHLGKSMLIAVFHSVIDTALEYKYTVMCVVLAIVVVTFRSLLIAMLKAFVALL
jgi:hypothetical protein